MFEDKSITDSLFFPVKYEEQVDNAPDYVDIAGDDEIRGGGTAPPPIEM